MARGQADPNVRALAWDVPLLFEAGLADRIKVIDGSFDAMPFANASFDAVSCSHAMRL